MSKRMMHLLPVAAYTDQDWFDREQDLVVRPLDARLGKVPHILAAAVLDDGDPALIVDSEDLMQSMQHLKENFVAAATSKTYFDLA